MMYSDREVISIIKGKYDCCKSLRKVAKDYEGITHMDIKRIVDESRLPNSPKKRLALGATALALVPVCKHCGESHPAKQCPKNRKPRYNWRWLFGMTEEELERRLKW